MHHQVQSVSMHVVFHNVLAYRTYEVPCLILKSARCIEAKKGLGGAYAQGATHKRELFVGNAHISFKKLIKHF